MKKLISLLLTLTLVLGMQAFAYTSIDTTGLTLISGSNSQYITVNGSNITYSYANSKNNLMDGVAGSYWVFWGDNSKSPTINAVLNTPMPVDTVYISLAWGGGNNSPVGTFGIAAYATFVDGTVERLAYTSNTITEDATALILELANKTKPVKMISVSRVPRNTLDGISGFYDAYTGSAAVIKQAMSISELRIYVPSDKLETSILADATVKKGDVAVSCINDGYTEAVANILAGKVANPLSAYTDMPALNLVAAQYFDANGKLTNAGAVISGDTAVTLAAGESVVIDLGKYKALKNISIAANSVDGLKIKGGKSNVPVSEMEEISTISELALADGFYTGTNSGEDKYRYIALENAGSADITVSEVMAAEKNPAPTITKRLGIGAWANGTWNWSNANNVLIPGTSYMYRNYINFAELNGKTYTMLVALYDKDGRMIDIASGELTAEENVQQEFVVQTGNGNARLETTKIKAILIDNLSDGTIYNIEEYTVQAAQ